MSSTALREGVQRLEIMTRVTLGVLALASGVYTYLGVRELLNGNATSSSSRPSFFVAERSAFRLLPSPALQPLCATKQPRLFSGCWRIGRLRDLAMRPGSTPRRGRAAATRHRATAAVLTRDLDTATKRWRRGCCRTPMRRRLLAARRFRSGGSPRHLRPARWCASHQMSSQLATCRQHDSRRVKNVEGRKMRKNARAISERSRRPGACFGAKPWRYRVISS